MIIVKIFYALLGIGMGLGTLRYRKVVYSWTGKFYWAEKYLGSGGTILVITLVGLGLIFVSVAYPFGVFDKPANNNAMAPTTSGVPVENQ